MRHNLQTSLTRTDCTRDRCKQPLPHLVSTALAFQEVEARPGYWVAFEQCDGISHGRVIGRVHCEHKTYLEVACLTCDMAAVHVAWVLPCKVRAAYKEPPRNSLGWLLAANFNRPDAIFGDLEYGVSRDREELDHDGKRIHPPYRAVGPDASVHKDTVL